MKSIDFKTQTTYYDDDVATSAYDFVIDGVECELMSDSNSPTHVSGMTGQCYLHPDYIIKVSDSLNPRGEIALDIEPHDQKYFAMTIFVSLDRSFLVQERIEFANYLVTKRHEEKLLSLVNKYCIGDVSPYKNSLFNCGIDTDGIPRIYDYEFNRSRAW